MQQFLWFAVGVAATLLLKEFLPGYARKKGENLATKQDLGELTAIAERIKTEHQLLVEQTRPFTAEETLRRTTSFSAKLDAFYRALDVVLRNYAANPIDQPGKSTMTPASAERPTEAETNLAYGRLAMFANDRGVLDRFQRFYDTPARPGDIGDLVALMRKDLGLGDAVVAGEAYPYILIRDHGKSVWDA